LAEYQSLEETELREEGSDKELKEECVEEVDDVELLVLRMTLSGQKSPNHEEQRENIFHKRCTINSRVCSLTVDGRSSATVASTTLVEKLHLRSNPVHILTPSNGLIKVKDFKFLLVA